MPCSGCNQTEKRKTIKFGNTEIIMPNGREVLHYARKLMHSSPKATPEEQQKKLNHCYECEEATNIVEIPDGDSTVKRTTNYSQCKKCACLIFEKVKFSDEACPKGKW